MMKNAILPFVCLILGASLGYSFRGVREVGNPKSAGSERPKDKGPNAKGSASDQAGISAEEKPEGVANSLADQVKDMLVDYDARSALKAAKKLSVQEF